MGLRVKLWRFAFGKLSGAGFNAEHSTDRLDAPKSLPWLRIVGPPKQIVCADLEEIGKFVDISEVGFFFFKLVALICSFYYSNTFRYMFLCNLFCSSKFT